MILWEKTLDDLKPFLSMHYQGAGAGVDYATQSVFHRIKGFDNPAYEVVLLCGRRWRYVLATFSNRRVVPVKGRCKKCERLFKQEMEDALAFK